jgi:opacity protein-like surface antigen
MKSHLFIPTGLCLLMSTMGVAPAHAQEHAGASSQATRLPPEVTAYVSYGSPASSRIGAAIALAWTENASIEVEVGYRPGEYDALSSSVNLIYDLPRIGRVTPYLAAGAGVGECTTAISVPGSATILKQSTLALTVNAGGGVKVPVADNWGLRADARWFNGFGRNAGERWRVYNGITFGTGSR